MSRECFECGNHSNQTVSQQHSRYGRIDVCPDCTQPRPGCEVCPDDAMYCDRGLYWCAKHAPWGQSGVRPIRPPSTLMRATAAQIHAEWLRVTVPCPVRDCRDGTVPIVLPCPCETRVSTRVRCVICDGAGRVSPEEAQAFEEVQ